MGLSSAQPEKTTGPDGLDRVGLRVDGPTLPELALYAFLEEEGVNFIREWNVPTTTYRVDAFDPETKTAYEADGHPEHFTVAGQARDRFRERVILASGYVDRFERFTYEDLRPWM